GGKALESAQAVAPADAREHVGEKRLGGHDGDLACSGWSEPTRSSPRSPSWLSTAKPAYGPVKSSNGCAPRNNGAAVTRPSAQVKVAPRWWPVSNQAHALPRTGSPKIATQ